MQILQNATGCTCFHNNPFKPLDQKSHITQQTGMQTCIYSVFQNEHFVSIVASRIVPSKKKPDNKKSSVKVIAEQLSKNLFYKSVRLFQGMQNVFYFILLIETCILACTCKLPQQVFR